MNTAQRNSPMIAICDDERNYACHLMEYLRRHTAIPYEANVYTSTESLLGLAPPGRVACLVIAESEYTQSVCEKNYERVLILNESDRLLGDFPRSISKYQSMDNIAAEVLEICRTREDFHPVAIRHGPPMKLVGVYSPISRCLQTTISLSLGQILARSSRVLYLNFENYSGLDLMLNRVFGASVADLIYFNECAQDKFAAQLNLMVEHLGGLDFIPPMKSFIELRSIRSDQWLSLFNTIERVSEYEYLILDLTESTDGLLDILRECDTVYMLERSDSLSQAKIKSYERLLKDTAYEDIYMKTARWQLPVFRELPATFENLTHGDLADYIRRNLKEYPI